MYKSLSPQKKSIRQIRKRIQVCELCTENMEINPGLKDKHLMEKEMNHRQCFAIVVTFLLN